VAAARLLRRRLFLGCVWELRLRYSAGPSPGWLLLNLISNGTELFYRPAHTSGKFGQLLRAEQQQDNEKDHHHVGSHEIENTSDRNRHKKSPAYLFGKKVVLCSIHSYRSGAVIFPESRLYGGSWMRRGRFACLFRKTGE